MFWSFLNDLVWSFSFLIFFWFWSVFFLVFSCCSGLFLVFFLSFSCLFLVFWCFSCLFLPKIWKWQFKTPLKIWWLLKDLIQIPRGSKITPISTCWFPSVSAEGRITSDNIIYIYIPMNEFIISPFYGRNHVLCHWIMATSPSHAQRFCPVFSMMWPPSSTAWSTSLSLVKKRM